MLKRVALVAVNFCRLAFTAFVSFLSYIASQTSTAISVRTPNPSAPSRRTSTPSIPPFSFFGRPSVVSLSSSFYDDVINQRPSPPDEERVIWLVDTPLAVARPLRPRDQLCLALSVEHRHAEALAELLAPIYEDSQYTLFLARTRTPFLTRETGTHDIVPVFHQQLPPDYVTGFITVLVHNDTHSIPPAPQPHFDPTCIFPLEGKRYPAARAHLVVSEAFPSIMRSFTLPSEYHLWGRILYLVPMPPPFPDSSASSPISGSPDPSVDNIELCIEVIGRDGQ